MNPQKTSACIKPGQNLRDITFFCNRNSSKTRFILIWGLLKEKLPVPFMIILYLLKSSKENENIAELIRIASISCSIKLNVIGLI